jgi:hypothetical protein
VGSRTIPIALALLALLGSNQPAASSTGWMSSRSSSPYVREEVGDLPIVFGVPHGGKLRPAQIPDRRDAVVVDDPGIEVFARDLADAIEAKTGRRPTLVLNALDRSKLDPNRDLALGAQGDPVAIQAWQGYHDALDTAAERAVALCGRGHFFDLHSHGESGRWIELGYGLSADDLAEPDEDLAKRRFVYRTNIRALVSTSDRSLPDLIRGVDSLGGRIEGRGYRVSPSPGNPRPPTGYFDGGYSVFLHGSRVEGAVDATQIEVPYDLLQAPLRAQFVEDLAESILGFMASEYRLDASAGDGRICPSYVDVDPGDRAYDSVEALAGSGAVLACSDEPRRFCPAEQPTRAEAAAMLWQILYPAAPMPAAEAGPLADLNPGDPLAGVSAALWRRGYVTGCDVSPPQYCPGDPLSREDLAVVALKIARGRGYLPPPPDGIVAASVSAGWGAWWLAEAIRAGLMASCPAGSRFARCAEQPVTRGEMVATLAAASGLLVDPP